MLPPYRVMLASYFDVKRVDAWALCAAVVVQLRLAGAGGFML